MGRIIQPINLYIIYKYTTLELHTYKWNMSYCKKIISIYLIYDVLLVIINNNNINVTKGYDLYYSNLLLNN